MAVGLCWRRSERPWRFTLYKRHHYTLTVHKNLCSFRAELAQALAETDWGDKSKRYFLSREEEHVGGLKAATAIW